MSLAIEKASSKVSNTLQYYFIYICIYVYKEAVGRM